MTQKFHSWVFENTTIIWKDLSSVHSSIIYNCQDMEAACLSTKWMDTEDVVLYMCVCEILLSHKKEWQFEICNKMDGLGAYYD